MKWFRVRIRVRVWSSPRWRALHERTRDAFSVRCSWLCESELETLQHESTRSADRAIGILPSCENRGGLAM